MNRLLIFDTKPLQKIIREFIEESSANKELFVSILQIGNTYQSKICSTFFEKVAQSLP